MDGRYCFDAQKIIQGSFRKHSMYGLDAYIDPRNHLNVGIYISHMERLGSMNPQSIAACSKRFCALDKNPWNG